MAHDVDERSGEIWRTRRARVHPRARLDFVCRGNSRLPFGADEQRAQGPEAKVKSRTMEHAHKPAVVRTMEWDPRESSREILLNREWLVANGLGGYASGTISGAITRRYHGLLIAALPAPHGRVVMWNHVSEFLRFGPKDVVSLGGEERAGGQLDLQGADFLREFRLEDGLPIWTYHVRDIVLEKRVVLPHLQNTVHVSYRVLSGEARPRLELRPAFHFRHHEASVDLGTAGPYKLTSVGDRYEIAAPRRSEERRVGKECGGMW